MPIQFQQNSGHSTDAALKTFHLILLCPLIPKNSGLSGHSRKQTPETADTSKTQNIPSYMMWVSPYSFHSFSAPFVGFTGRSAFLAGSGPALDITQLQRWFWGAHLSLGC